MTLEYDVVVATKDRLQILSVSLPLILQQTHKPKTVVVVDSSTSLQIADKIRALCEGLERRKGKLTRVRKLKS